MRSTNEGMRLSASVIARPHMGSAGQAMLNLQRIKRPIVTNRYISTLVVLRGYDRCELLCTSISKDPQQGIRITDSASATKH